MKTAKIIFVALVAAALSLMSLNGCDKSVEIDEEPLSDISQTADIETNDIGSSGLNAEEATEETEAPVSEAADTVPLSGVPLGMMNSSDGSKLKNELIEQINMSRTADQEPPEGSDVELDDYYRQVYVGNDISDISEFYFPTVKIDGYELYRVLVSEWTFMYYYAPIEEFSKEKEFEYVFTFETGILLGINRPHWMDNDDPLKALINQHDTQEIPYVLKDNLIYTESHNGIAGQIGNTRFNITVPDTLNDFEFLYALGLKVIETSELVFVK